MRKEQEKIIKKAKKHEWKKEYLELLSREDLTIKELEIIYHYLRLKHEERDASLVIKEIIRCLNLPHQCSKTEFYKKLQYFILPEPYWTIGKDDLFGSHKKNEIAKINIKDKKIEYFYCTLLSYGIKRNHIRWLMRKAKENSEIIRLINAAYTQCPLLLEHFNSNKEESFLYYCIENNIILSYDFFQHIAKIKMDTKFIETDKEKYSHMIIQNENNQYHINTEYFEQYAGSYRFLKDIRNHFVFDNKCIIQYCPKEEVLQSYKEIVEKTSINTIIKLPLETMYLSTNNSYLNIKIYKFDKIEIYKKNDGRCDFSGISVNLRNEYFISPDLKIYEKRNGKTFPLSIKRAASIRKYHTKFHELLLIYENELLKENNFMKDILTDRQTGFFLPLTYNQIPDYHNKQEYLEKNYKITKELPIKWNKINMNLAYFIIKSYNYVEPGKSREILLQQKDTEQIIETKMNDIKPADAKQIIISFLALIIVNRINKDSFKYKIIETGILKEEMSEEFYNLAYDYVKMCLNSKEKVKLTICSEAELRNKHDNINDSIDYDTKTKKVNIPEDSCFNNLRKMLPKEFEWIKTRKRLIMETKLQHHCVWSYADKISNDECAIYSYIDQIGEFNEQGIPKRYTIEFSYNNGDYKVVQVQGRYDKVNTSKMKEYIDTLLKPKAA